MKEWYLRLASMRFESVLKEWSDRMRVAPKATAIREMPKRWGSCTPSGKIILNPELIKAPAGCIEYVVVHELCHLVYKNHSPQFVRLQAKMMPDWERWKMRLERLMA